MFLQPEKFQAPWFHVVLELTLILHLLFSDIPVIFLLKIWDILQEGCDQIFISLSHTSQQ